MFILGLSFFSEEERVDAFLNPQNIVLSEDFLDKNKDNVLLFIAQEGITYPTELGRALSLHVETVNKILARLKKDKLVNKIYPDRWHPQPMFEARIPEFQNSGLDSHEKVSRASWWHITVEGVDYIKQNYGGQGKRLHRSIVEYYSLQVLPNAS